MESREIQNMQEDTIDLAHLVISVMKKWKIVLIVMLAGGLLGAALQWVSNRAEPERSREDAALVEKMTVAASSHMHYEELKHYVESSAFMQLDHQNAYSGTAQYFVSECENPEYAVQSFYAIFLDESVRKALSDFLGVTNGFDLDRMVMRKATIVADPKIAGEMKVDVKKSIDFCVDIYGVEQEQVQKAIDFICEKIDRLPARLKPGHEIELESIYQGVRSGVSADLREAQTKTWNELNEAFEKYTIQEDGLTPKQYKVYEEYFLTGKAGELPTNLFLENPLKMPLILAIAFGFLVCVVGVVQYLMNRKVKNSGEVYSITGKEILGFVDETDRKKCGVDRWLEKMENSCYPPAVSAEYIAAAVAKIGQVVAVYDEQDDSMEKLVQKLSPSVPCMALMSQNLGSLEQITQKNRVVILVKLGVTSKAQIRRETAMCSQYGIELVGTILVK